MRSSFQTPRGSITGRGRRRRVEQVPVTGDHHVGLARQDGRHDATVILVAQFHGGSPSRLRYGFVVAQQLKVE